MTTDFVKLHSDASLKDAHELTSLKGIRHLPVVDKTTGKLLGIVTQKSLLAKVMHSLSLYGSAQIVEQEQRTRILEIAETDYQSVLGGQKLTDILPLFLQNKHGCLPVLNEQGCLIGMVTSSDFVQLCARLLEMPQR